MLSNCNNNYIISIIGYQFLFYIFINTPSGYSTANISEKHLSPGRRKVFEDQTDCRRNFRYTSRKAVAWQISVTVQDTM